MTFRVFRGCFEFRLGTNLMFACIIAVALVAVDPPPAVSVGGRTLTSAEWEFLRLTRTEPAQPITPELRERLRQAGRDGTSAPVSIFFAPPKREGLDALARAGVERAIFGLPSAPRDDVLPRLVTYAKLLGG